MHLARERRPNRLLQGLFALLLLSASVPVSEAAPEIGGLKSRQTQIQKQTTELRAKRNEKLRQARQVQGNIVRNQILLEQTRSRLNIQQSQVSKTQNDIGYYQGQIRQKTIEMQALKNKASRRLKNIYMGERLGWLELLLTATSLSEMTDELYFAETIVGNDKTLVAELNRQAAALNAQKAALERKQARLEQEMANINQTKSQLASQIANDSKQKQRLQSDAAYYARAERELLSESYRIQQQIRALTAPKGVPSVVTGATGSLVWPIRGPITSRYGYRIHPIHRTKLMHTGLDIAGPNRGAVKAADGGTVIESGWRGGYGRVIMINHGTRNGKNFVTLYGHLSGSAVSVGQHVSKGQTIGYEGSTGYSTGPHLHFEVRLDGATVDPSPYLP
ncbi:MAG: peptidoglycan DD-metalloendopeptidase family protein [Vampirovibrionales bacterium]|nr:peptidoglycan DD-metalloendopeptidase family protein [Vampirovibrionales bacterium]